MINRDTIWNETYQRDYIRVDAATIEVFTAIHHYTGSGRESRLDLCAELNIRAAHGPAEFKAEFELTAEQMEDLSEKLMRAAERTRANQELLDEERAAEESAAREAIRQAKEAA